MGNNIVALTADEARYGNDILKTPIEIALGIDENGMTTARALYAWLELDPTHYSRWAKENITENPYADENEFSPFMAKTSKQGGRTTEDYKITASLAKRISMASKSDRGEDARKYFLGCEQMLARLAEEKHKTEIERAKGIAVRQALTKAIQQSNENERMHGHAYSTYADVIYKALFNKNAKQLREEYGIEKKDNLRDCLTSEELKKVQDAEMLVSSLIAYGWGYDEIKNFIIEQTKRFLAA